MSTAPSWKVWTALWIVYVVWGSTYLAIAYVVETLPALLSAAFRFALAAVLLLAWVRVRRGRDAVRITGPQLRGAAVVGLLLLLGGNGMVVLAEDYELPSGLAALLVATVPLFVVVLRLLVGDRARPQTVAGVTLGFVGVAVLLLPGARPDDVAFGAAALVVLAALLWSIGSFRASRAPIPGDALTTTALQMAAGAAGLALVGLLRGESLDLGAVSLESWLALGYLVVFGSLVAYTAYTWVLGAAPVSKVSTYAYVNPVVAVGLGALFRDEHVTATTLVGGGITVVAVAIVVRAESASRRRQERAEVAAAAAAPHAPVEPGHVSAETPRGARQLAKGAPEQV